MDAVLVVKGVGIALCLGMAVIYFLNGYEKSKDLLWRLMIANLLVLALHFHLEPGNALPIKPSVHSGSNIPFNTKE